MAISFYDPVDSAWADMCAPKQGSAIKRYIERGFENASRVIGGAARRSIDIAKRSFEYVQSGEFMSRVRNIISDIDKKTLNDKVKRLVDILDMQNASPLMQRYVCANPTVRKKLRDQQLDGYSDTYTDPEPDKAPEWHKDYLRVINGHYIQKDGVSMQVSCYYDDDEDPLNIFEQDAVLSTWSALDVIIACGQDDPTSASGEMM